MKNVCIEPDADVVLAMALKSVEIENLRRHLSSSYRHSWPSVSELPHVHHRISLAIASFFSKKRLGVSRQGAKAARHFRRLELRQAPARQEQQPAILFDTT
jgi:hypothetical protein